MTKTKDKERYLQLKGGTARNSEEEIMDIILLTTLTFQQILFKERKAYPNKTQLDI